MKTALLSVFVLIVLMGSFYATTQEIGGTDNGGDWNAGALAFPFTASNNGNVLSLGVDFAGTSQGNLTNDFALALYSGNLVQPDTLLGSANGICTEGCFGWWDLNISGVTIINGNTYWVSEQALPDNLFVNTTGSGVSVTDTTPTYPMFNNPFVNSSFSSGETYHLRVNYSIETPTTTTTILTTTTTIISTTTITPTTTVISLNRGDIEVGKFLTNFFGAFLQVFGLVGVFFVVFILYKLRGAGLLGKGKGGI